MKRALATIILLLPLIFLALPASAFDFSQGIVGNLPEKCRLYGDCSFCDFIELFVILQKIILSLFGGLALIMIIWGGQGIITAAGNETKISEAKKLITSTLLGVLIILVGYFLITVLVGILVTPAGSKSLNTKNLFGQNWITAFCASPADKNYCQEKTDGESCTYKDDSYGTGPGNCKSGACVTACEYTWGGQSYICKNSTACSDPGTIKTGLCPGPTNYVCCK